LWEIEEDEWKITQVTFKMTNRIEEALEKHARNYMEKFNNHF